MQSPEHSRFWATRLNFHVWPNLQKWHDRILCVLIETMNKKKTYRDYHFLYVYYGERERETDRQTDRELLWSIEHVVTSCLWFFILMSLVMPDGLLLMLNHHLVDSVVKGRRTQRVVRCCVSARLKHRNTRTINTGTCYSAPGPVITFSISFSFVLFFVLLPFFLKRKNKLLNHKLVSKRVNAHMSHRTPTWSSSQCPYVTQNTDLKLFSMPICHTEHRLEALLNAHMSHRTPTWSSSQCPYVTQNTDLKLFLRHFERLALPQFEKKIRKLGKLIEHKLASTPLFGEDGINRKDTIEHFLEYHEDWRLSHTCHATASFEISRPDNPSVNRATSFNLAARSIGSTWIRLLHGKTRQCRI